MWKGDTVETLEEAKPGDIYHGIRIGRADGPVAPILGEDPNGPPSMSRPGAGVGFRAPTTLSELEARVEVIEAWLRARHQIA